MILLAINHNIFNHSLYNVITGSDTVPVPLEANSTQTWDSKTGYFTYKTDWRIPEDNNVQRVIGVFELRVDAIAPDGTIELLHVEYYNVRYIIMKIGSFCLCF